jgi:hypothetical protein
MSCVERFDPTLSPNEINILIVEGYINAGPGETVIRLSRATALSGNQLVDFETFAKLAIVDNGNASFPLVETQPGTYKSGEINLPTDKQYRLYMKLSNGAEYSSELLPVKITPAIDSLSWEWNDYLDIFVNSHDPESNTHYYQWEYQEDWQIRSPYRSTIEWKDDTIKERDPLESLRMLNCWKSSRSHDLIFSSSYELERDVVKYNLIQIPKGGEQTSVKYSVIVKQHALTQDAYNYLRVIEKNTSQVGSFFDPMPSELFGNVHNLAQPDEPVVGYVGVSTTETKILFIENRDLPFVARGVRCPTAKFKQADQDSINKYLRPPRFFLLFDTWTERGEPWMSVMVKDCLDCRVYGSNVRPSYW